jgi:hypothetical protein
VEAIASNGSVRRSNQNYRIFTLGNGDDFRYGFDLLWPENDDSIQENLPEFIWNSAPELNIPGIIRYKFYYDTNPLFTAPSIIMNIADTFITPSRPLLAGETYYWKVEAVIDTSIYCTNFDNFSFFTDIIINVEAEDNKPYLRSLYTPYPNPFNSATSIKFETAEPADISIIIYNILGQQVKQLVSDYFTPGAYNVQWNSNSGDGYNISSGIYLVVMRANTSHFCKKIVLIK